jgi:hypothetical protein
VGSSTTERRLGVHSASCAHFPQPSSVTRVVEVAWLGGRLGAPGNARRTDVSRNSVKLQLLSNSGIQLAPVVIRSLRACAAAFARASDYALDATWHCSWGLLRSRSSPATSLPETGRSRPAVPHERPWAAAAAMPYQRGRRWAPPHERERAPPPRVAERRRERAAAETDRAQRSAAGSEGERRHTGACDDRVLFS